MNLELVENLRLRGIFNMLYMDLRWATRYSRPENGSGLLSEGRFFAVYFATFYCTLARKYWPRMIGFMAFVNVSVELLTILV